MRTVGWCLLTLFAGLAMPVWGDSVAAVDPAGLKLELRLPKAVFEVGEPVPFELVLTNTAQEASLPVVTCDPKLFPTPEYTLLPLSASVRVVQRSLDGASISAPCDPRALAPGGSIVRKGFLNRWAVLSTQGRYSFAARWQLFGGGTARIEVAKAELEIVPGTQESRNRRYEEAAAAFGKAVDVDSRQQALAILAFTLDPRAIATVAEATGYPKLRRDAADLLWVFPDYQAVRDAVVSEIEKHGPNATIIYSASHLQVPDKTIVPVYAKWVEKGGPQERASALRGLSMHSGYIDKKLKTPILKALNDPEPSVRCGAVLALGGGKYGNTLPDVMWVAENDKDDWVRGQATSALAWYKSNKTVPLLRKLLRDSNRNVAYSAANALDSLKTHAATRAIEDCAKAAETGSADCKRILQQREGTQKWPSLDVD